MTFFRTEVKCYRVASAPNAFAGWERYPMYDETFDEDSSALAYMDQITAQNNSNVTYVFSVKSEEVD